MSTQTLVECTYCGWPVWEKRDHEGTFHQPNPCDRCGHRFGENGGWLTRLGFFLAFWRGPK